MDGWIRIGGDWQERNMQIAGSCGVLRGNCNVASLLVSMWWRRTHTTDSDSWLLLRRVLREAAGLGEER